MNQIYQRIKSGAYPNRSRLATAIEVTTKTIQRDVDFMRERMGLPIAFNLARGGYEFTEPVAAFPMVELSEGELFSVLIAQKALAQYKGTPFQQPLRTALEKLVASLDGRISVSFAELDSHISFRNFEIVPADLRTFQTVREAVRKNAVLQFEYKKLNATRFESRIVEPYHLACIQDQWYCFGHDLERGEIRTFVLARMRGAAGTGQTFVPTKKFRIEDHLKDSLGVFSAEGQHRVRIRFDRFAAQLVRERIWQGSQEIQELAGGGLEFRVILSSLHEIEPWVLSWGVHAQVLGPPALRKKIGQVAEKQAAAYRK